MTPPANTAQANLTRCQKAIRAVGLLFLLSVAFAAASYLPKGLSGYLFYTGSNYLTLGLLQALIAEEKDIEEFGFLWLAMPPIWAICTLLVL